MGSFACRHDFEAEVFDVVFTDATLEGPQIGVSGAQEEDVDGFDIVRNCKGFHNGRMRTKIVLKIFLV